MSLGHIMLVSGTKIGNNEEESEMGGDTRIMVGWTSYLERTQLKTFTNDCMRCIS